MHSAFGRARARRGLVEVSLAIVLATGGGIAVPLATAGSAAEFDQGARLASICAACHDADGRSDGIPPLTGLDEKQIIEALARYRANESPSIVMHAITLSLTEDEVQSVARYLAGRREEASP